MDVNEPVQPDKEPFQEPLFFELIHLQYRNLAHMNKNTISYAFELAFQALELLSGFFKQM